MIQDKEKRPMKKEKEYYESVKEKLEQLLTTKFGNCYLEITADKRFSNKLKAEIGRNKEIIFSFLKEAAPDITGFIKGKYRTDFVIVEVKRETIKLDDIYQAKKYGELFDANYAFLISTGEIPDEIKGLSRAVLSLLLSPILSPTQQHLTLVHFDENTGNFVEWFEKNPFEKA